MTSRHLVLVVEDDTEIRETIMETLEDHGYEPIGAVNGRDALDKLRWQDPLPCLILLDLMMPEMDGKSFRQEQLKNPALAGIPVIAISAYQDLGKHAQELGLVEYLKKPLKIQGLIGAARRHC